jgi:HicA toxin of bacterial toxin-antitoxin,
MRTYEQFRHPEGRGTTVPFHKGRDISPVLLRKIARDIGMSAEEVVGGNAQFAEPRRAADCLQRPLRSRFQQLTQ